MTPASGPTVSVVVPAYNEGASLAPTIGSLLGCLPADAEVIVVDDRSTDDSALALTGRFPGVTVRRPASRLGSAGARNFGARLARGEVVVFADGHVEVVADSLGPLLVAAAQPGVGAVAPAISFMRRPFVRRPRPKGYGGRWGRWHDAARLTWTWGRRQADVPYPVPLLSGCFVAVWRAAFHDVGGFDEGMIGWGHEDAELSVRLWTFGYHCLVVPSVEVSHELRPTRPYHIDPTLVLHNVLRMAVIHFSQARLARLLAQARARFGFASALSKVMTGDAWARRREVQFRQRLDDDWFFDRFGMD